MLRASVAAAAALEVTVSVACRPCRTGAPTTGTMTARLA